MQSSEDTSNELVEQLRSLMLSSQKPNILPKRPSSSVDMRHFQRLDHEPDILAFLQATHSFAVESLEVERTHESAEG
jgi:hypothetical protein